MTYINKIQLSTVGVDSFSALEKVTVNTLHKLVGLVFLKPLATFKQKSKRMKETVEIRIKPPFANI